MTKIIVIVGPSGIQNTFSFYDMYKYPCIDTSKLSPEQVADEILAITKMPDS